MFRTLRATFPVVIIAAVPALTAPRAASAAVVNPGGGPAPGSEPIDFDPGAAPLQGQVLATQTTPFEIRKYSDDAERELFQRGQLEHWVVRESETGYLSFHYRLTGGESNWGVVDAELTTIDGFSTYLTELRYESGGRDTSITRSADGNGLTIYLGDVISRYIVVRTDAPAFAAGGEFRQMIDFEPTRTDGSAVLSTFRPVPEPGAAGLLLTFAAPLLMRRRRAAGAAPHAAIP